MDVINLTVEETKTYIEVLKVKGNTVKIVKNLELCRMSGSVWEDLIVNGKFYANIVDGKLAGGTMVRAA